MKKATLRHHLYWCFAISLSFLSLQNLHQKTQKELGPASLSGRVLWAQQKEKSQSLTFAHEGKIKRISVKGWPKIKAGDSLQIHWQETDLNTPYTPNTFSFPQWLKSKGISGFAFLNREALLLHLPQQPTLKNSLHHWLNHKWERHAPLSASFLKAGLLGLRETLNPELRDHFQKTGLAHLLAISGFHMLLIYCTLLIFLGFFPLSPRFKACLMIAGLWGYACLTPLSISVLRSCAFLSLQQSEVLFGKKLDAANSLGLLACLFLWLDPTEFHSPGFALSFSATWSLLFLLPPQKSTQGTFSQFLQNIKGSLQVSWVTTLGTLPALLFYFQLTNPGSLLSNLLALPLCSLILIAGLFLSLPTTPLHTSMGHACDTLFSWMDSLVEILAEVPLMTLNLPPLSPLELCLLTVGLLFLGTPWKAKSWFFFCLCSALFFARPLILNHIEFDQNLRIHFIDVGQGDAILFQTAQQSLLLDAGGGRGKRLAAKDQILPYLNFLHLTPQTLWITHPDWDHYGGVETLLQQGSFKELFWNAAMEQSDKKSWQHWKTRHPFPHQQLFEGDVFALGSATLEILPFKEASCRNSNACSLLLGVRLGNQHFLFNGDLEAPEELSISFPGPGKQLTGFKLGHHGSKHATTQEFLTQKKPQIALNSCGRKNRYGHPHPSVTQRLEEQGIPLFSTHELGTFILDIHPNSHQILKPVAPGAKNSLRGKFLHFLGIPQYKILWKSAQFG